MSEQEIREGMLLAVWDEPPLDFDPDTLIRRVEQKKSRRRALVGVGLATAMIVAAAVSLPSLIPRGDGSQIDAATQTSASPTSTESMDTRKRRIGDALVRRLSVVRPDLQGRPYADFDYVLPYQPEMPIDRSRAGSDDLYGYVQFTDGLGPTALLVATGPVVTTKEVCSSQALFCREREMDDGSTIIEAEFQNGPEIVRAVSVRTLPSGKKSVVISSYSHNPATGSGTRQNIPMGVEVLTALVTDPQVDWD